MKSLYGFRSAVLLVAMMAFLPLLAPVTASAQDTTIWADFNNCRTQIKNHYQVQLNTHDFNVNVRDFPASVTLHFEDGRSVSAVPNANPTGTAMYYYFNDNDFAFAGVRVSSAETLFDTTKYPNYTFKVTGRPCVPDPEPEPTYAVTGTIVQRGNERPVADLTVCLVEAELCTTTDASGSFSITGVEDGTYTLYSDGNNWKPQYNTVTVSGGDVHVNVIQFKGGGKDK